MKQLTDEQIVDEMPADLFNQNYIQLQIQFGMNVIAKFCKENNLTGEAQPAEQAKGQEAVEPAFYLWERKDGSSEPQISSNPGPHPDYKVTACYTTPPAHPVQLQEQPSGDAYMDGYEAGLKAQPAREWVGLTDDEIEKGRDQTFSINNPFCPCDSKTMRKAVRWAESKLREKNAGQHDDPEFRREAIAALQESTKAIREWAAIHTGQPAADSDPNAPWLTEAHMLCTDHGIPTGHITERIRALREKLAADDKTGAEPVYQYKRGDGSWIDQTKTSYDYNVKHGASEVRVLYTHPKPQAELRVPDGYALVPVEPTEEMHAAAVRTIQQCTGNDDFPPRVYRAMLAAAAPKP